MDGRGSRHEAATSNRSITDRGGYFGGEARTARNMGKQGPWHSEAKLGLAQRALPGSPGLFFSPAGPTLTASCPGHRSAGGPQLPPSLLSFLEVGLMASEHVWPGTTAQGNLSTEPRGLTEVSLIYTHPGHTVLSAGPLLQRSGCLQLKLPPGPDSDQQVLGPNVTSLGNLC